MNVKVLKAKSPAELRDELLKLRREQFNLRMSAAAGQPAKPNQFGLVRKSIARIKTVLNQKRAGGKV
jgi:large subunit ribosomal protein L29